MRDGACLDVLVLPVGVSAARDADGHRWQAARQQGVGVGAAALVDSRDTGQGEERRRPSAPGVRTVYVTGGPVADDARGEGEQGACAAASMHSRTARSKACRQAGLLS